MDGWSTCDRDYSYDNKIFTKRELRIDEWHKSPNGEYFRLPWSKERLYNEHAALKLIAEKTTIPAPKVLKFEEVNGIASLTTEWVNGTDLRSSSIENREEAVATVQEYIHEDLLPQLRKLKCSEFGSLTGHVIPQIRFDAGTTRFVPTKPGSYTFVHGDLAQQNFLIDKDTYKVKAVLDWEYSGFYPAVFELPLWLKSSREPGYDEIGMDQIPELMRMLKGKRSLRRNNFLLNRFRNLRTLNLEKEFWVIQT